MKNIINLNVAKLKEIIKDLPDDMDVIIPVIDYEDSNYIDGFRHIRTAGILSEDGEKPALCLNSSSNGVDIVEQLKINGLSTTNCDMLLF